jgi:hypothetical protein
MPRFACWSAGIVAAAFYMVRRPKSVEGAGERGRIFLLDPGAGDGYRRDRKCKAMTE